MSHEYSKCSVLMCLYKGDTDRYFREAVDSVFEQSVQPDELIIVVDGAICNKLDEALTMVTKKYKKIKVIRLPRNVGVGMASNEGIKHCKNELIAKMDADDVAVRERFELQLAEFAKDPKLALLGGQLAEFSGDISNVVSHRKVPTGANEIKRFAKKRSPFNNQTVMYKKSVVLAVGGYPKLNRAEDYYLFSKIIAEGYKVKNLSKVLMYFRLDDDAIGRRRTWKHTKEIINARNEIRKLGVSNYLDLISTSLGQIVVFITPAFFAKWLYRRLRK
ncbi:MAG: glycosyltransferase [Candidatus Saccharimonadales bacterium]